MIPDQAVVALAIHNFEAEQGDGEWDHLPESIKPGWLREARAQCEAVAPHLMARSLEDAADSIDGGGSISKWLRARAGAIRRGSL